MSRKLFVSMALVVVASLVGLMPASVMAAEETGSGPAEARLPWGGWTEAVPGSATWYRFEYAGDGSQIEAWMEVAPESRVAFSVWTPEQIQRWANGESVEPVGRGSPNPYATDVMIWSGNFNMPGTYYLVVENTSSNPGYYALHVTGTSVTLLAALPVTAATAEAATELITATTGAGGSSPAEAKAISGESAVVAGSGSVWYAFNYAGDQSQINVWLTDNGAGLTFSVWTPEEVHALTNGQVVDPVGRGSANEYAAGDLSWSGNFPQAGVYYVSIENPTAAAVEFTVGVSGSGVWQIPG